MAMFLTGRGHDVRDVCANRTSRADRARQRGKSDALDSERIARETLAHPLLPKAFKRAVRPRLAALARRNPRRRYDAPTRLRLQLLDGYRAEMKALDRDERHVVAQLEELVRQSGSTLSELCGLSTRSVAELLVEVGDPRRFTRGRVRALQRTHAPTRLDRRGARRADPPPLQPRRQPAHQRDPLPDDGHAAALRAACPAHLRKRARRRAHQEGSPPNPQTPPLRRYLPPHGARPTVPAHGRPTPSCPRDLGLDIGAFVRVRRRTKVVAEAVRRGNPEMS
jgi:hypothetical protein